MMPQLIFALRSPARSKPFPSGSETSRITTSGRSASSSAVHISAAPPAPLTSERIAATLPQAGGRGLLRGQRRNAFPRGRYGSPFFLLSLLQLGAQIGRAEYKPPLTLGVMALHAATFLRPDLCLRWLLRPGARITDVALHPAAFWEGGLKPLQKARQLILSAATHREPFHLYWNAVTFFWQGSTLEARLGSKAFGKLIGTLLLTSHSIFVAGSWLLEVEDESQPPGEAVRLIVYRGNTESPKHG